MTKPVIYGKWNPIPAIVNGIGYTTVHSDVIMYAINDAIIKANAMTPDAVFNCLNADPNLKVFAAAWEYAKRDLVFRETRSSRYFNLNEETTAKNIMRLYADHTCKIECINVSYSLGDMGTPWIPGGIVPPEPPVPPIPPLPPLAIDTRALIVGLGDSYIDPSDNRMFPDTLNPVGAVFSSSGLTTAFNRWCPAPFLGIDAGRGGATAQYIIDNHLAQVKAMRPMVVVVRLGTNDISMGVTPETFESNMNTIVSSLGEVNARVVITEQTMFKGATKTKVNAFNKVIDKIASDNPHVTVCKVTSFDSTTMMRSDGIHPTSYGSYMYGKDIANAVNAVITSTWTRGDNLIPDFGEYVPVDTASTGGATGKIPTGWRAQGKLEHSKGTKPGWHTMKYIGDHVDGENFYLSSSEFTNTSTSNVKVQASCLFECSDLSGNNDAGWNNSDRIALSLQETTDWTKSTIDTVGDWNGSNGGNVPEGELKSGYLELAPGDKAIVVMQLHGGLTTTSNPVFAFSDVRLTLVEGTLPPPPEPSANLIVNGTFEGTIAPWQLNGTGLTTVVPQGDGTVKVTTSDGWYGGVTQKLTLDAGKYKLKFDVASVEEGTCHVMMKPGIESGNPSIFDSPEYATTSLNQEHEVTVADSGIYTLYLDSFASSGNRVYTIGNVELTKL